MRWTWGIAILATIGGCYWTQAPPPRIALIPGAPPPSHSTASAPVETVCAVVPLPNERVAYRAIDESVDVCVVDDLGTETCRRQLAAVYDAERRRCGPRAAAEPATVVPSPPVRSMPIPRPTYHAPTYGGGGPVHVRGYYRRDGTYVRPHTRRRPR